MNKNVAEDAVAVFVFKFASANFYYRPRFLADGGSAKKVNSEAEASSLTFFGRNMKTVEQKAAEIARLLEDGKGDDVVVINVSELNSWTDYFVIATITSSTQCQGLCRQVKEYGDENDLEIHLTHRKSPDGDDWNLIDLGSVVVHLMSKNARGFYELERLWHAGTYVDFHGIQNQ